MSNELEQSSSNRPDLIGNKLAESWTKEATIALMDQCHNVINNKCYFLSEVADAVEQYPDLFRYLARKFDEDVDVFRAIKRLYNKCEAIITRKTAEGEIQPALGIFILKAYHNLIEVSKVQTDNRNLNVNVNTDGPMTPEKAKAIRDKLKNDY